MNNLSALDLGFWGEKAIINGRRVFLKGIVGNGFNLALKDLQLKSNDEEDFIICRHEGAIHFLSDLAIKQSDTITHSLQPNRFDSEATRILVNAIFALGFNQGEHKTFLVSGLPISHFERFKEQIQGLFLTTSKFNYDVTTKTGLHQGSVGIMGARFIPQPFAVAMDRLLDDNGNLADKALAGKTLAVIDGGFGTSDIYVSSGLEPIQRLTFSSQTAMNHSYRLIANRISDDYGVILPLYKIESIARTGKFKKSGTVYDMSEVVKWAYKASAEQLFSEIYNKWKNLWEIDHVIFAGGSGNAFAPFIQDNFSNVEIKDTWSVASGYWKWGRRNWKHLQS